MALFTAIGTAVGATAASAFATGLGVTALAGGAVAYSMMNKPKAAKDARQQAQMPTAPVKPVQADAAKIAQQQAADRQKAAARSKSVMTSPLGLKDEAQVARKKLLGG